MYLRAFVCMYGLDGLDGLDRWIDGSMCVCTYTLRVQACKCVCMYECGCVFMYLGIMYKALAFMSLTRIICTF